MTIVIDEIAVPPCAREPEMYNAEALHSVPRKSELSASEW